MIRSESLLFHLARLSLSKFQLEGDVVLYNLQKGNSVVWFMTGNFNVFSFCLSSVVWIMTGNFIVFSF